MGIYNSEVTVMLYRSYKLALLVDKVELNVTFNTSWLSSKTVSR